MTLTDSADWCSWFAANAARPDGAPWGDPYHLTNEERVAVAASIREFQLGESSEGRNLHAAARDWSRRAADPGYLRAIEHFIREEQRHARLLARFLAHEGIPLRKRSRVDDVFRRLRRGASLETSIVVLLTAELIAQVYYVALRNATASPLLRALCDRIIEDEAAHVRFQSERLAIVRAGRPSWRVRLAGFAQRALLAGAVAAIWPRHGPVFRRAGMSFRVCWRRSHLRFDALAPVMLHPPRAVVPSPATPHAPEPAAADR